METTTRKAPESAADMPVPSARALKHLHPTGIRDEVYGQNEQGRMIRQVPDRTPTYLPSCKACQEEDRARMAAPPTISAASLENTLFLIPETEYDGLVARAYLTKRYPDAKNVACAFHAEKLSYVKGAQIVVITRRGINGKSPGPRTKRTKDEEGTFFDQPIDPDTYLEEIVESSPLVVAECMDVVPATMFSEQSVDMRELTARIAERAQPFRIAPPADPKDRMYVMRLNA